jgi:hypothetical protein
LADAAGGVAAIGTAGPAGTAERAAARPEAPPPDVARGGAAAREDMMVDGASTMPGGGASGAAWIAWADAAAGASTSEEANTTGTIFLRDEGIIGPPEAKRGGA